MHSQVESSMVVSPGNRTTKTTTYQGLFIAGALAHTTSDKLNLARKCFI
jgi:hypothetical protein